MRILVAGPDGTLLAARAFSGARAVRLAPGWLRLERSLRFGADLSAVGLFDVGLGALERAVFTRASSGASLRVADRGGFADVGRLAPVRPLWGGRVGRADLFWRWRDGCLAILVIFHNRRAEMASHEGTGYMASALAEARKAAARGEVPVGAVLVSAEGVVLARAGNRTRELCDPSAHAEVLVIRSAAALQGSERLPRCDLYVTLEPCGMCAALISFARIRRLYFGAADPKAGGVLHGPRFFSQPTCHHSPEIYDGLSASPSEALLRDFFEGLRAREC